MQIQCNFVHEFAAFDRHTSREPDFDSNADYGITIWPKFVYDVHPNIANDNQCSALCLLAAGPCHLFKLIGTDCYLGRFGKYHNTVLGDTAGPFFQLTSFYSMLIGYKLFRKLFYITIILRYSDCGCQ